MRQSALLSIPKFTGRACMQPTSCIVYEV